MKTVSLSGVLRAHVGKKDAKQHRKEGRVPCVLYGGKEQVHFAIKELDFDKIIFSSDVYLVKIDLDGKKTQAILQDVQFHPVTDKVLHADFLEVSMDKPITIGIPVQFEGNAPGVMAGGRLIKKLRKVIVKGLVEDMPDYLMVNMSELKIGDNIKVSDLELGKLEPIMDPNTVIVLVKTARGILEDELEEEEEEEGEEGEEGAAEEGASEETKSEE
ncbi:MAG: 50S ribosomal protein L25/general stress protein Ctc [bacterium]|jgi:large subunit ribosomal protein L25